MNRELKEGVQLKIQHLLVNSCGFLPMIVHTNIGIDMFPLSPPVEMILSQAGLLLYNTNDTDFVI